MPTREIVVHPYIDDQDAPGTCRVCHVPDPRRTNKHHKLPDLSDQTAEHDRRAGDHEED